MSEVPPVNALIAEARKTAHWLINGAPFDDEVWGQYDDQLTSAGRSVNDLLAALESVPATLVWNLRVDAAKPKNTEVAESLLAAAAALSRSLPVGDTPNDEELKALVVEATTPIYPSASDEVWKTNGVMPIEQNDLLARFVAALTTPEGKK